MPLTNAHCIKLKLAARSTAKITAAVIPLPLEKAPLKPLDTQFLEMPPMEILAIRLLEKTCTKIQTLIPIAHPPGESQPVLIVALHYLVLLRPPDKLQMEAEQPPSPGKLGGAPISPDLGDRVLKKAVHLGEGASGAIRLHRRSKCSGTSLPTAQWSPQSLGRHWWGPQDATGRSMS